MSAASGDALLAAGYCLAALALVFYVVVENSAVHVSSARESSFLAGVLFMVQLFHFAHDFISRHELCEASNIYGTVRLILFMNLCRVSTSTHRILPYKSGTPFTEFGSEFGAGGAGADPAAPGAQPNLRMWRVAHELQTAFHELLDPRMADFIFKIFDHSFMVPILYFLFILSDFKTTSHRAEGAEEDHGLAEPESHWNMGTLWYINLALYFYYGWLLWWKNSGRKHVKQSIHKLISEMVSAEEKEVLDHVMRNVSIGALVEVCEWETVLLLTQCAVDQELLSTLSKTIIVDALQKKGLRSKRVAREVLHIVLSLKDEELTHFKQAIDEGGDYFNLYKLVYKDISDPWIRKEMLSHFSAEAREVRKLHGGGVGVKVLSDVDDTLYSSGGRFPAGCDQRFPKHVVYPGCLSLFRILDRTPPWTEKRPSCNLVFISARPHLFKDYAEGHSYELFKKLVDSDQMHNMPTLLPGELRRGLQAVLAYPFRGTKAWRSVGKLKEKMYQRFRDLYQEYDFIFFGDNGQGDFWAGQTIAVKSNDSTAGGARKSLWQQASESLLPRGSIFSRPARPVAPPPLELEPRLLGVLIHEVIPRDLCLTADTARRDADWEEGLRQRGLLLHRSYVGASLALHLREPAVVSLEQVYDVAAAAMREFDTMRLTYPEWGVRWDAAFSALQHDVDEVNEKLEEAKMQQLGRLTPTADLCRATECASSCATTPTSSKSGRSTKGVGFEAVSLELKAMGSSPTVRG